jgi:hypothetical protein
MVRNRAPPPVVVVAAVPHATVPIPVVAVEALGDLGCLGLRKLVHPSEVVALRGPVDRGEEVDVGHD